MVGPTAPRLESNPKRVRLLSVLGGGGATEVVMGFGYHYHRVVRDGELQEMKERHLHARLLAETPKDERRRRSILIRFGTLFWRRRGTSAPPGGRLPVTIAVTAMAVPVAGLDPGPLESDAAVASEPRISVQVEMTQSVWRLPDGSLGRIAIERSPDDGWTAVCVVAPEDGQTARVTTPSPLVIAYETTERDWEADEPQLQIKVAGAAAPRDVESLRLDFFDHGRRPARLPGER